MSRKPCACDRAGLQQAMASFPQETGIREAFWRETDLARRIKPTALFQRCSHRRSSDSCTLHDVQEVEKGQLLYHRQSRHAEMWQCGPHYILRRFLFG